MSEKLNKETIQQLPLANVIHWVAVSDTQPNKETHYFTWDGMFMIERRWKGTFWEGEHIANEPKVTHWTIIEPPCV